MCYLATVRRCYHRFTVLPLCFFSICAWSEEPDLGFHLSLQSLNYSEPVPVKANFDEWATDDFKNGERIYTKQSVHTGMSWENTTVGLNYRLHYYLEFSQDTALWYYLEENDEDQLALLKRSLDIDLNANHVTARGFFVAQRFEWQSFVFNIRANYLKLDGLTYGRAWGSFDPSLDLENQTQLIVDYSYDDEESILDRQVDAPSGTGWIFDYSIFWEDDKHSALLQVDEAWSRLEWDAAPASRIQGNLVDLKIRRDAALQFEEFYSELDQSLPSHSRFTYMYQMHEHYSLGIDTEAIAEKRWNRFIVQSREWNNISATLAFTPDDDTTKIALSSHFFDFSIESDKLNFDDARTFNLSLGVNVRF